MADRETVLPNTPGSLNTVGESKVATAYTMKVHCDKAQYEALVREFDELMESSPPWLRWLVERAIEGISPEKLWEILQIETTGFPTAGAFDIAVRIQPLESLLKLMAALRAGNGQQGAAVVFE